MTYEQAWGHKVQSSILPGGDMVGLQAAELHACKYVNSIGKY